MLRSSFSSVCIALAILIGTASPSWAISAFVLWVTDGDTITVVDQNLHMQRIRVYGIDCPESKQAYGFTARLKTAWEVWLRPVTMLPVEKDRYNRLVARVQKGNHDLSARLLTSGLAWVYDRYCDQDICNVWKALEGKARNHNRGLWIEPDPVPPWKWRRGQRANTGWRWW